MTERAYHQSRDLTMVNAARVHGMFQDCSSKPLSSSNFWFYPSGGQISLGSEPVDIEVSVTS